MIHYLLNKFKSVIYKSKSNNYDYESESECESESYYAMNYYNKILHNFKPISIDKEDLNILNYKSKSLSNMPILNTTDSNYDIFKSKSSPNIDSLSELKSSENINNFDIFNNILPKNKYNYINSSNINKEIYNKEISNLEIIIHIDDNFNIINIDNEGLIIFEYTYDEIINKFIGIIMNDISSKLHYKLLNKYNKNHLDIMSIHRQITLISKNKKAIYCNIKNFNNNILTLEYLHNVDNNSIYLLSNTSFLNNNSIIKSNNKVIIINLDIIDSTNNIIKNGIKKYVNHTLLLHNIIKELLSIDYKSYIYIHEIVGDCYIFIMNIDFIEKYIGQSIASICYKFIKDLYNKINNIISFRIGIVYDYCYYGKIDNIFRIFGKSINLSSRIQSKCKINEILVTTKFYKKLIKEDNIFDIKYNCIKETYNLKNFGKTICYRYIIK